MKCIRCNKDIVVDLSKRGPKPTKFCSVRCRRNYRIILFRRRLKIKAVAYLGGKCAKCGYNKCMRALQFHHRDRNQKEFGIAHPSIKAWKRIQKELDKCDLLCSNCHAEEEDRLLAASITGSASHC